MQKYLFAAILAGVMAPIQAQTSDTLWNKVRAQLNGARRWVAADIDLVSDANNGSQVKQMSATFRLSGWKEGKPVYELVKIQPPGKEPPKDVAFLNKLTSLGDDLTQGEALHRIDGQSLDGIASTLFETHFDKTLQSGAVKLWVDPASGAPRQMIITIHTPLTLDATVTTRYAAGPQGYVMPAKVDYAIDVLIPFKKAKMHMQQTTTSWVAQPAAAAQD